MIPGQYPQATGGNRQRFVKAKLGRKIRHRLLLQSGGVQITPGRPLLHIGIESPQHLANGLEEIRLLQPNAKFRVGDLVENRYRVMIEILPCARGQFLEHLLRPLVPGPPKVSGQLIQPDRQFG